MSTTDKSRNSIDVSKVWVRLGFNELTIQQEWKDVRTAK